MANSGLKRCLKRCPIIAMKRHPRGALIAGGRATSIADEIVAGGGVAEWWPALGAPVIDHAGLANERLEAFGLAYGSV